MKKYALAVLALALVISCAKVPITGRKQLNLLPESELPAEEYATADARH